MKNVLRETAISKDSNTKRSASMSYLSPVPEEFNSLKTMIITKEELEANSEIIIEDSWNKGLPKEESHWYGKKHTEESKKKISRSKKGTKGGLAGVPRSEETKCKMSLATKGKKSFVMSDEQKRKMSESIKAWHKNRSKKWLQIVTIGPMYNN